MDRLGGAGGQDVSRGPAAATLSRATLGSSPPRRLVSRTGSRLRPSLSYFAAETSVRSLCGPLLWWTGKWGALPHTCFGNHKTCGLTVNMRHPHVTQLHATCLKATHYSQAIRTFNTFTFFFFLKTLQSRFLYANRLCFFILSKVVD